MEVITDKLILYVSGIDVIIARLFLLGGMKYVLYYDDCCIFLGYRTIVANLDRAQIQEANTIIGILGGLAGVAGIEWKMKLKTDTKGDQK